MFNKWFSVNDGCDAMAIAIWSKNRKIQPYGCIHIMLLESIIIFAHADESKIIMKWWKIVSESLNLIESYWDWCKFYKMNFIRSIKRYFLCVLFLFCWNCFKSFVWNRSVIRISMRIRTNERQHTIPLDVKINRHRTSYDEARLCEWVLGSRFSVLCVYFGIVNCNHLHRMVNFICQPSV